MTEAQLKAFPEFKPLPIYDESDQRADTITTVPGAGAYRAIRECSTVGEVQACLKDPDMVPLGGLRAGGGTGSVVVAYFGKRR